MLLRTESDKDSRNFKVFSQLEYQIERDKINSFISTFFSVRFSKK